MACYLLFMRKTSYTKEYIEDLRMSFLSAFNKDKRIFSVKLYSIGMPKGTYSRVLNGDPVKKMAIERMRAFLEKREPKFLNLKQDQAYCHTCEQITLKSLMKDAWRCKKCKGEEDKVYRQNHPIQYSITRRLWRLNNRDHYLQSRRKSYLRKHYGKFAGCVETIMNLSKEIKNEK